VYGLPKNKQTPYFTPSRILLSKNELEEQATVYGAAIIPLELKNQIKVEKEAITELEDKLRLLTG
jgi:hypothetical protein